MSPRRVRISRGGAGWVGVVRRLTTTACVNSVSRDVPLVFLSASLQAGHGRRNRKRTKHGGGGGVTSEAKEDASALPIASRDARGSSSDAKGDLSI